MIQHHLASYQATERLGACLANVVTAGCCIYLLGELGAGKTTLVRGFLHHWGYQGKVKSPTYTLVEPYTIAGREVWHCDLYRLSDPEELVFLGIRDFIDGQTVLLIEWPERGSILLPRPDVRVTLEYVRDERRCCIQATSECGQKMLHSFSFS